MERVDISSLGLPDELYYALPVELVELISERHRNLLTTDQIRRERQVSNTAEQLACVGFKPGGLVNHRFLRREIERGLATFLEAYGAEDTQRLADQFYGTLEQNHRFVQGYCGWLISNADFLRDLDNQLENSPSWSSHGLPQPTFGSPPGGVKLTDERADEVRNWRSFLQKWRLQSMESLDLPCPFEPQLTNSSPYTGKLPPGLAAPIIPDIYPVKGKGAIANQIESIRSQNDHLAEWKSLISSTARKTKRVDSLGRQFQLQHYWRVLTQRYPSSLSQKRMKLQELFAAYFDVETDSIKRDLKAMKAVLKRPLSDIL